VAYYLLFYWVARESFFELGIWWGGLLPLLTFMILGTRAQRAQRGSLNLLEGIRTSFIIFMIGALCFYILYYILLQVDQGLLELQSETALKNLERFNRGDRDDLEQIQEYYQEGDVKITIGSLVFRYVQSLIGGFILSLPIGFLYKQN
ncbi:MAG: DUF4199 domain-containing protein, partial [Bacteroidota bacterium]